MCFTVSNWSRLLCVQGGLYNILKVKSRVGFFVDGKVESDTSGCMYRYSAGASDRQRTHMANLVYTYRR